MNKRIYWSLGVGLLGLLLVRKGTNWFSVTYLHDTVISVLGAFWGAIIGFLLGYIADNTTDERSRRFKVLYWLLVMAIFGSFLGLGRGVPVSMTMTVLASTLGIGLLIGLIQYFLQRHRSIEVSETYSDGKFGSPKTRSSRRVIPMSQTLCEALKRHRASSNHSEPQDLVYSTTTGTPLSPKNLYNRVLAPACDKLNLPRVSWHSFRHGNATLLGEVGESVKTAQAILGHSDIETTLNTYMHAIPDSQRRAVERVAGVLFPHVPKLAEAEQNQNCGSNHGERS